MVEPAPGPAVEFGKAVRERPRCGGPGRAWTIVGEDEADPARGLLSRASPRARALRGAEAGDEVARPGGPPPALVLELSGGG